MDLKRTAPIDITHSDPMNCILSYNECVHTDLTTAKI